MKKIEKYILHVVDHAFVCNINAHKEQDKNSGYWSLSYKDMNTLWYTSHLDWYNLKQKFLDHAIHFLQFKYKGDKIRWGCSSDRKILYIQYWKNQMSFHKWHWGKRLTPFFHWARKWRVNEDNYRFVDNLKIEFK